MGARQVVWLLSMAIAGCGGGAAMDRASQLPVCDTRTPGYPADTLTIVLFDRIDLSNAPWGRNREERFVFGHLYETLVTVDCRGRIQPAIARQYQAASDGWLIELRDDVRFWDGSTVTAYDAAAGIKQAIARGIAFQSVDVVDEHSLILHGFDTRPDLKLLAHPMTAVTKTPAEGGVAIGTGRWMLDETVPVIEAVTIRPSDEAVRPIVRFVQGNVSDARDILDGTADAMITDDPSAIEYAREKERVALVPLAWDRSYVLVSRTRADAVSMARHTDPNALPLPDMRVGLQNALARDVSRVDARGGSSLLRVSEVGSTPVTLPQARTPIDPVPAILYETGDETARGLAERIIALGAMDSCSADAALLAEAVPNMKSSIRAKGVDPITFRDALASGQFFGYVVPLSWNADYPTVTSQLMERAGWAVMPGLSLRGSSVSLVETRAHFVAISDRIGYLNDHNGGVRILGGTSVTVR